MRVTYTPGREILLIALLIATTGIATAALSGTVTAQSSVPSDLSEDVSETQFAAVAGDDGQVTAFDLANAINERVTEGSVDGVDVGAPELRAIGNYWAETGQSSTTGEVQQTAVSPSGSKISVATGEASFVSVSNLPSDVSVSNISADGIYLAEDGSILWSGLSSELPETVSFQLTPDDRYASGDTIDFTSTDTSITLDILAESPENETSVPSGLADTITEAQFSAIDSDGNGKISKSELTTAKTEYEQNGAVNGVMITLKDITTIEVYYGYDLGDDDSEDPQFDDGGSGLQTSEVRLDGSTIRISSEGLTSFSIADLPNNVRVSNVGDGVYDPNAGEILVGGPTNPAPDTYEFTLNPDTDEYAVGDTVEFTVQGNAVTIPVVQAASIPSGLADKGVSSDSYNAVVGTDEKLGAGNLASAIQSWSGDDGSTTGSVGETNVGAGELSSMIRYWSNQIGG